MKLSLLLGAATMSLSLGVLAGDKIGHEADRGRAWDATKACDGQGHEMQEKYQAMAKNKKVLSVDDATWKDATGHDEAKKKAACHVIRTKLALPEAP